MSSRHRAQVFVEHELGCVDVEKWKSYAAQFENFKLTSDNIAPLKNAVAEDTADLYFKAILSIAEAINSLNRGLHSWSVVKLYYSVFYLLKCALVARGYCFIKSSGIYTIKMEIGEKPVKRDVGKRNGDAIRGDHKTVISTYIKEAGVSDFFLSNHIDGDIVVFDWIMKMREDVHYRNRNFHEPDEYIFSADLFKTGNLGAKVAEYFLNSAYCFTKEDCCLAVPLWLARRTAGDLEEIFDESPFTQSKLETVVKLLADSTLSANSNVKKILFC